MSPPAHHRNISILQQYPGDILYSFFFFNNHKKHFVLVFPEVPKKIWFYKNLMRSLLLYTNKTNDWFLASRVFMFFVTVVQNLQVWIFLVLVNYDVRDPYTHSQLIKKEKKKKEKKSWCFFGQFRRHWYKIQVFLPCGVKGNFLELSTRAMGSIAHIRNTTLLTWQENGPLLWDPIFK